MLYGTDRDSRKPPKLNRKFFYGKKFPRQLTVAYVLYRTVLNDTDIIVESF